MSLNYRLYSTWYFICTLSAFFLQNYAQSHTRDSHASIIISLEAVFGFILGIWILNESLTSKSITGCLLIFCGVLISKADHIQLFNHSLSKNDLNQNIAGN